VTLTVVGELWLAAHLHALRLLARARPLPVQARINSRSNSAKPPNTTVSVRRPYGVVVSAHASLFSERKPAPLPVIAASVFKRSRVERASRSSSYPKRALAGNVFFRRPLNTAHPRGAESINEKKDDALARRQGSELGGHVLSTKTTSPQMVATSVRNRTSTTAK